MNIRSSNRPIAARIRAETDGLWIDGPAGPVRLRRNRQGISAEYQGQGLMNGSAVRYADQMRAIAVHLALDYEPPWQITPDGGTRITDHRRFYAETFLPGPIGIETLKQWLLELGAVGT